MAGRRHTHSEEWWATQAPDHVLRCLASLKSTGARCRREAAPGASVCERHGALAPQVQAAAAVRIGMSLDDAVKRLQAMLDDPGVEAREKVKILHDLLDRGGLSGTQKHIVGVGTVDPVERLFQDLLTQPGALADPTPQPPAPPMPDAAQAALDARQADPDWDTVFSREIGSDDSDDVVDAELVEDSNAGPRSRTVVVEGSLSDRPPKWLEEDLLRRLI